MPRVYVLDTNVLLADPGVLLSHPDAEIVIPETVLAELDKLKTSRADADLRFRGREVSRLLFDLSEQGSLTQGVDLPDGGSLRVATFDDSVDVPEGLSARNSDDRILAVALKTFKDADADTEVSLITNDLNMLLKAQTLGMPVQRHGDGTEGGFARRYIVRPFQRYKVPLGILALAVAVFAAVIVLSVWGPNAQKNAEGGGSLPPEFRSLLNQSQAKAYDYLLTLQSNPTQPDALLGMANTYLDIYNQTAQLDPASAIQYTELAAKYYQRYLSRNPSDVDARVDYAISLFYDGKTDQAIQQVSMALSSNPQHVLGNLNLGVFYWRGQHDYAKGTAQFQKVIKLTKNDPNNHSAYEQALAYLSQLTNEQKRLSTPTTGTAK